MRFLAVSLLIFLLSCSRDPSGNGAGDLRLITLRVGAYNLLSEDTDQVPVYDRIFLTFTCPVDTAGIKEEIGLFQEDIPVSFRIATLDNNQTISLILEKPLRDGETHRIILTSKIKGECGVFPGLDLEFRTRVIIIPLELLMIRSGNNTDDPSLGRLEGLTIRPEIELSFSEQVSKDSVNNAVSFSGSGLVADVSVEQEDTSTFILSFDQDLSGFKKYRLVISDQLVSAKGNPFAGASYDVYTSGDTTCKFPEITDEELLTKIQEQTFRYFWDFAHPVSGLSRERNTSGDLVTIGGSGFGVMAILVGMERGFITRDQGIARLSTIVNFLSNQADRFHGAWSHWLSGSSGDVIPFSSDDDGGDLVETAFMVQGLYTLRQYLDESVPEENSMIDKIDQLIDDVEWDWYTQGGQNVLYWHWSPNFGWQKNHRIRGWNEALIVYVLAASSTTHPIDKAVYDYGWARNGAIRNTAGNEYYGYQLPLRSDRGGPLFFAHYSFLGLDPRNLEDAYANYWEQNLTHTRINRAYCIANPMRYVGYSEKSWGLTASDGNTGYSAHSPDNDRGVITPTAAISSIPYTPESSMEAIRFFYYILGDKLWGEYGFHDAFNVTQNWYANSYIAIDQGPIICMIENYRTGLLWDLFMSAPEIQDGLEKLGFSY